MPEDILSCILRQLVQLDDSYEMQCRYSRMAWQIIESDNSCDKICRTERLLKKIPELTDGNQSMVHGLIRATVEYFSQDEHMCLSMLLTTFYCAMDICNIYTRIGMPDYAMDKLEFLAQTFLIPPDRIDRETAGVMEIVFYSKYKIEQAFCMVSRGWDQEALAMMNHVLGFPEDIDSVHLIASFGSLCQDRQYKKLDEGADVQIDMISTLNQLKEQVGPIVWPTAVLVARQLQCRRVNIDRQNQGCFHGDIYDPVLTEGMNITELETDDWETHDG